MFSVLDLLRASPPHAKNCGPRQSQVDSLVSALPLQVLCSPVHRACLCWQALLLAYKLPDVSSESTDQNKNVEAHYSNSSLALFDASFVSPVAPENIKGATKIVVFFD